MGDRDRDFVVEPSGLIRTVAPSDGRSYSTTELQGFVGGYVEQIPFASNVVEVWANEDGTLLGLASNPVASALAGVPLVGAVLFTAAGRV